MGDSPVLSSWTATACFALTCVVLPHGHRNLERNAQLRERLGRVAAVTRSPWHGVLTWPYATADSR